MTIRRLLSDLKAPPGVAVSRIRQMHDAVAEARRTLVQLRHQHMKNEPVFDRPRELELLWHEADDLGMWQAEALMRNWLEANG